MWSLTIRNPSEKVIEYHPKPGLTRLGRADENDIVLKDDALSRSHAEVEFDHRKRTLKISDLNSSNGTFVNGKRIIPSLLLEHGDQIRMGKCLITVKQNDTERLESKKNIISLTPALSQALLVESIESFGLLLNDLSLQLINVPGKNETIEMISDFTLNMIDATACQILMKEELDDLSQKGVPPSIAQIVIEERTPILISNVQADKSLTKSLTSSKISSLIIAPVIIGTNLSGIIYAYQEGYFEKAFNRNDLQLVMAVSNQVALTVQRFEHESELIYHANHDPLTKLPNRTRFLDRLEHAVATSKRKNDFVFTVFFFDVDNFKLINDSLGHIIGDKILINIGERLTQNFRNVDTIARIGGDEFVILYENLAEVEDTFCVANRLIECFAEPFIIENEEIYITISVGGTTNMMDYSNPEEVLRDADIAMYRAKENGGNNFQLYDSLMHKELVEVMELQSGVRKAIYQEELVLHYQPVVSLQTGKIVGFEALVRWNSPEKGFLGPDSFLPKLDTNTLLNEVDLWVMGKALDDFSQLNSNGRLAQPIYVSINISERTFFNKQLTGLIDQVVTKSNLMPDNLVFEITERANIKAEEAILEIMNNLRSKGIRLSLDDFGTGYSTLGYLHRFPIDYLKIDKSFVQNSDMDGENSKIVETIVSLADHIGMSVVAEGVETRSQLEFLRNINCGYAQGYYFSHPIEFERVEELLNHQPVWK
jgi:diguanylate cyclase (GGDEF)-like protein